MEKFEQPQIPPAETPKEAPKPEGKKMSIGLYDVNETAGGFEVVLPGLFDKKRELIVGTRRENFTTREEAEQAIEKSREADRVLFERASLEKTYQKHFFRIDETKEGKFRVVLPGLVDSKNGYYVGTSYKEFDSWDEAKEHFLKSKENEERFSQKPLLEVQTGENEKIAFSQLDAFNPRIAPSEQPHEIPESIKTYLMGKGRLDGTEPSASTYQETIKEKDWERKLFSFVSSYLEKDGVETLKELGIEHLDALTPKQAIDLATRVVIDLTKYKWSDTKEAKSDIPLKPEKSGADKNTVQQLLQEGLSRKNDPDWEGNGVCRNFASSVKGVFEALKTNQTRFSQLRDTYALYEGGMDEFAPKRQKKNVMEMDRTGHAWNTFVTVSREGAANATVIDATWAKRNLDTKEVEGLDHTLLRMEPVVHAVGQNLSEGAPNKEEQIQHLLSYYVLKIEGSKQVTPELPPVASLDEKEKVYFREIAVKHFGEKYDLTSASEEQIIALGQRFIAEIKKGQEQETERQFFTTRAVELMKRQGVPKEIPPILARAISEEYQKIGDDTDKSEIETIYKISQNNSNVDFGAILRSYLKEKPLSDYHAESLIFADNNLQMKVFDQIKFHKDYEKLIKESPKFRAKMREAVPQLFLDFSPGTKPEDATELKYLAGKSRLLSRYESMIDPRKPSEERINGFFEKARQALRAINPEKYDEMVANLDNYQLIKQYDRLDRELKG
ncbi:hypothetical protein GW765_02455 [Candidatus Parcubacteria bacterium]|uniref:Uncharacterized protein n=1 Tax=Candidatus Nomurabacteria bacterium CG1_02_47_685 TaxID=1805282 RepID=A0A1J4V8J9_9BACT|nr:hypothetical protein [Candidatus Parcubacteria bacterium]OIO32360.1 MAG: hypothetical protein AUJ44_02525 [Candidatus Nomurabacteria bacterium CG1_02_47_685]